MPLDVIGGRADQEVRKVDSRFRTVENEVAVQYVIELFDELIVVEVTAELHGMGTDDLAEVVEYLKIVFDQAVGTAGHAEDHVHLVEIQLGHTFDGRRQRNDAIAAGSKT